MNKTVVVLGLLVAVMSVSALGAGFMGPATAELKKGQWSAGYNYMYSDMDLKTGKMTGTVRGHDDGVLVISIPLTDYLEALEEKQWKFKLKDFKTQRHYATFGYGVQDWWEVYFQLGCADVKAKMQTDEYGAAGDAGDFNFDNDFAWGWGTRITFHEQGNIRWGASVQMNWLDISSDRKAIEVDDNDEVDANGTPVITTFTDEFGVDLETYDLLIAVGPTVDMGGWKLYGGPFFYYLSGNMNLKYSSVRETSKDSSTSAMKLKAGGDLEKADSNFGGFIGAQFALWGNTHLTTEFSFTGDSSAFGAGVSCKF